MLIEKSAIVPYSAAQMFDVVTHVEAYPTFLEWCSAAQVKRLADDGEGAHVNIATLNIAYKRLSMAFSTRNVHRPHSSVEMELVSGPFRYLQGQWSFAEVSELASHVSLAMRFEFSNILTRAVLSNVFEQLVAAQMQAFAQRAKQVYG